MGLSDFQVSALRHMSPGFWLRAIESPAPAASAEALLILPRESIRHNGSGRRAIQLIVLEESSSEAGQPRCIASRSEVLSALL